MHKPIIVSARNGHIAFAGFLVLLSLSLLGGGGARSDIQSLLYLRPAAVLCTFVFALMLTRQAMVPFRPLVILLAGFALTMLIQLVPLPASIWAALPGHGLFQEAAALAGVERSAKPVSLAPDLTLNSLVALVVPMAALLGLAAMGRDHIRSLLPVLIAASILSAILGVAQLTGGADSRLRLYAVTNEASAVGLFANRNHQAALLAATLPLLVLWAKLPMADPGRLAAKRWLAVALGIFLLPMVLTTGSRAGVLLMVTSGLMSILLARAISERSTHNMVVFRPRTLLLTATGIFIAACAVWLARAESLDRLLEIGVTEDKRISTFSLVMRMAADFFPFGTGFGTFNPVFRAYETDESLTPTYFNHAHNDLLETFSTGGLPAIVVVALFLFWWIRATWRLIKAPPHTRTLDRAYGLTGAVIIFLLLAASLVDYPLRTPLMAVVFVVACGWLCVADSPRKGKTLGNG